MVPQTGPTNMGAGPASDPTQALAQQLVDYIEGADKRNKEQTAATGVMNTDEQNKEALVAEVSAMIKAVVPHPQSPAHKDSGKAGGKESEGEGKEKEPATHAPSGGRKY
jgi:hypothetical protein